MQAGVEVWGEAKLALPTPHAYLGPLSFADQHMSSMSNPSNDLCRQKAQRLLVEQVGASRPQDRILRDTAPVSTPNLVLSAGSDEEAAPGSEAAAPCMRFRT